MRARKLFALGIAAIAAFAALCLLGEGDLATVRSAGVEVPAASNDPKPAAPADAATAADAQRTELPPAADGAVGADGSLLVEVVFAATQQPAVDAAVFVTPPSDHEGADAPGAKPTGRTGQDGSLRVAKPTASVFVGARHGTAFAEKFVTTEKTIVRLELREDDAIAVRVVDSAGVPLAGVPVYLLPGRQLLPSRITGPDGVAVLRHAQQEGRRDELRVGAALPGRYLTVPAPLREGQQPFVVSVGDVGRLVLVARDCEQARADVQAADGTGPTASCRLDGGRGEVVVAAALHYRIMASCGAVQATLVDVAGPVANGDRVEVELPLDRCRVRGRFASPPADKLTCFVIGTSLFGVEVKVAADGAFEVPAPRWPAPALLAFATERACCECPDARLDLAECDVGALALSPRPVVGIVDVVTPTGWGTSRNVDATRKLILRSGREVPTSMQIGLLVRTINLPDHGVAVRGLPSIASVTTVARGKGLFAEPESVVLQAGERQRIVLSAGGSAIVHLVAPDERGLLPLRLRPTAGGAEIASRYAMVEPGGQSNDFADLRPGEYAVVVEGRAVVAAPFRVVAGARAEVQVTLQPK